ncbi:MAG: GIN domain-containing protein, partial [Winogradskyella sp.]
LKVSDNSTVKAGTGAKAEILAGETLSAKVSFGGSIFYKGNPEVIKDKKVIGGIIEAKN